MALYARDCRWYVIVLSLYEVRVVKPVRETDIHCEMTFSLLHKSGFYQEATFYSFREECFGFVHQGLQFLNPVTGKMGSAYVDEERE